MLARPEHAHLMPSLHQHLHRPSQGHSHCCLHGNRHSLARANVDKQGCMATVSHV